MSLFEIVLLLCGGIIFVLSFLVPVSKQEVEDETRDMAKEEIKKLVTEEMEGVKSHVDDAVDEAVEYAMEKTERSLERLSNEKIMAVSDYSDTVMQEIHKNHEEVMFLYDMLNDKHTNLKDTVAQVNKTVKTVEEKTKEAEAAVSSIKELNNSPAEEEKQELPLTDIVYVEHEEKPKASEEAKPKAKAKSQPKTQSPSKTQTQTKTQHTAKPKTTVQPEEEPQSDIPNDAENSDKKNRNDEILELHRQGKSNVAIARQLGLGVGEVKLVIDLYKA
jgi:hypothetical protein